MMQGWDSCFSNSRILRQLMDDIASKTQETSTRCNDSMKRQTIGESYMGRWKSGKASIIEAVVACGKIGP